MGRLVDRKSVASTVLVGARKLLGLALVLDGVVSLLVYEFGGGWSIWGIDGYALPNWQVDLKYTLMFWPVEFPIWLGVILLGVCGLVAVFYGRRWLIWGLRIISLPMGAFAVWTLQTDTVIGDRPFSLAIIILVAAAWVIPIRRRKAPKTADSTAPNNEGASS